MSATENKHLETLVLHRSKPQCIPRLEGHDLCWVGRYYLLILISILNCSMCKYFHIFWRPLFESYFWVLHLREYILNCFTTKLLFIGLFGSFHIISWQLISCCGLFLSYNGVTAALSKCVFLFLEPEKQLWFNIDWGILFSSPSSQSCNEIALCFEQGEKMRFLCTLRIVTVFSFLEEISECHNKWYRKGMFFLTNWSA